MKAKLSEIEREIVLENFEWIDSQIDIDIISAYKEFKYLLFTFRDSIIYSRYNRIINLDKIKERDRLKVALSAISEVFRLHELVDQECDVYFNDKSVRYKITPVQSLFNDIVPALALCAILRDLDRERIISNVQSEKLKAPSVNDQVKFGDLYTSFVLEYFKDKRLNRKLFDELELMYNTNSSIATKKVKDGGWLFFLNMPKIQMVKSLAEDCETEFNSSLKMALENHQDFWSQKTPLNKGGTELYREEVGFLAFDITAFAAIAYDKGWTIEIESNYMPSYMVDGSFLKG